MNLTATQVIVRALRAAKVLGFDETAGAFTLAEGLQQLQMLLDRWRQDPHLHFLPDYPLPAFVDLTTPVAVPDGLAEPLAGSLAALMASENGQAIDVEIARATKAGLELRRTRLAALQVPGIEPDAVYSLGVTAPAYGILTGP